MSFVHLHTHSDHSLLDGYLKLGRAAEKAAADGQPALALTDHGTVSGWHEHAAACDKAGIKPLFGIEAYIAPGSRFDKTPVPGFSGAGAYGHITVIAKDNIGLRNLIALASLGYLEGFYRKPRIDMELLHRHGHGLIVTTGCPGSTIHTHLRAGNADAAWGHLDDLLAISGATVLAEVMRHPSNAEADITQTQLVRHLVETKKQAMLVATQDAHYIDQGDANVHGCMCALGSGHTYNDPRRFKFTGPDYWLKTTAEMGEQFVEHPEWLANTAIIADDCSASLDSLSAINLPVYGENPVAELWQQVRSGIERLASEGRPVAATAEEIEERLHTEMSLIEARKFASYFLMTADWVRWANGRGIRTGVARGSGGGSLVAYVIGIVGTDPFRWDLPWERFLNPERSGFPDFDIDIEQSRRHEVVGYLRERWGSENVASIGNHNRVKPRAAIKDACRVLGQLDNNQAQELADLVPPDHAGFAASFDDMHNVDKDAYAQSAELRHRMYEGTQAEQCALALARRLEGVKRANGQHAAGLIVTDIPVWAAIPVRGSYEEMVAQWDWREVEASGAIKLDLLTLTTLDRISLTIEKAGVDENEIPGWLTYEDPEAFYWLAQQHSLAGLFQIGNPGIADFTRSMKPMCTEDLSAAVALYRPGAMSTDMHTKFSDRKNGRADVTFPSSEIEELVGDLLSETYGVLAYQENVMALAQHVAGFSLGEADVLRRVMGKKKPKEMAEQWAKFEAGAAASGVGRETALALWKWVEPFAEYGFNRSHSVGYAATCFQTIQLARLYPEAWAASLLDVEDHTKWPALMSSINESGTKVLPVHHAHFTGDWSAGDGYIRTGLNAIKGLNKASKLSLIAGRPSTPIDALLLPQVRFCDVLSIARLHGWPERDWAPWLVRHQKQVERAIDKAKRGGWRHLAFPGHRKQPHIELPKLPPPLRQDAQTMHRLRVAEMELLGVWVAAHPLEGASEQVRTALTRFIDGDEDVRWVNLAVSAATCATSKRGNPYIRLTLEDRKSRVEVFAFGKMAARAQNLSVGQIVKVQLAKEEDGRVSLRSID